MLKKMLFARSDLYGQGVYFRAGETQRPSQ